MSPKAALDSMMRNLYSSVESTEVLDDSAWCPRCGTVMHHIVGGVGCMGKYLRVVPPMLVVKCPRCGYSERSWAC